MFAKAVLVAVLATLVAQEDPLAKRIEKATVADKAAFHVVFRETINSKEPGTWTETYNATVELYVKGEEKPRTFRGSTLPNFKPSADKPEDWKYSMILSNGAFPKKLRGRLYHWTRGRRADGKRPCLRMAAEVPTIEVAGESAAVLKQLVQGVDEKHFQYATEMLVHSGYKVGWRGSAGCLTIHPDDAKSFFEAIPGGTKGTLEVARGLHDPDRGESRYY